MLAPKVPPQRTAPVGSAGLNTKSTVVIAFNSNLIKVVTSFAAHDPLMADAYDAELATEGTRMTVPTGQST